MISSIRTKSLKNKEHDMLKETRDININAKKQRYRSALNDKKILKNIKQEIDMQQNNKNCFRHAKVKQEYYEGKTNQLKKSLYKKGEDFMEQEKDLNRLKIIENKMKKTYNKLELIEKKCIENLYKTKSINDNYKKKHFINIQKSNDIK